MSYQVLARKYRPQVFEDVLGQTAIVQTLANALSANRMAHALLFTGPRGTGKTSIARILAKAMNCEQGPCPVPCNQCKSCVEITRGNSSDVFEIDGASNNSVDQVRDLRENAIYRPSLGRYKIYIIDEVHMLSTAAFNALLKILEEPPAHVIFIFATTEVHKLPATILSRCQRHDLGRVSLPVLVGHLQSICDAEKFPVSSEVLEHVALEADGSVRDSLSLLDRILSAFPDGATDIVQVMTSLGAAHETLMLDLSGAVLARDPSKILDIIETVDDTGLDLKKFYSQTLSHFRDMHLLKILGGDHRAVNIPQARKDAVLGQIASVDAGYISMLVDLLLQHEQVIRFSGYTRIALEAVFLKMIRIRPRVNLDGIIARLDELAEQMNARIPDGHGHSAVEQSVDGKSSGNTREPVYAFVKGEPEQMENAVQESGFTKGNAAVDVGEKTSSFVENSSFQQPIEKKSLDADGQAGSTGSFGSWQDFLNQVQADMPFMIPLFADAQVDDSQQNKIMVTILNCSDFHRKRLQAKSSELRRICQSVTGKNLDFGVSASVSSSDVGADDGLSHPQIVTRAAMDNHPLVKEAQKIFHGTIVY